jgi:hypothetical protein
MPPPPRFRTPAAAPSVRRSLRPPGRRAAEAADPKVDCMPSCGACSAARSSPAESASRAALLLAAGRTAIRHEIASGPGCRSHGEKGLRPACPPIETPRSRFVPTTERLTRAASRPARSRDREIARSRDREIARSRDREICPLRRGVVSERAIAPDHQPARLPKRHSRPAPPRPSKTILTSAGHPCANQTGVRRRTGTRPSPSRTIRRTMRW